MKKFFFWIYLGFKSLFGTNIEAANNSDKNEGKAASYYKNIKKQFFDIYNVDREDRIDYTNTYEDHHSNFKHLDDPEDERFDNVNEQVGLIYEEDGKTPKNAAEVFDFTYEEYQSYKEKIIPIARNRKITEEDIKEWKKTLPGQDAYKERHDKVLGR